MNLAHLGPTRVWLAALVGLAAGGAVVSTHPATAADDPVALVRAAVEAAGPAARRDAVSRVTAHPDYRPSRLSGWLHQAWAYPAATAGTQTLTVPVGAGDSRQVSVIVPDGYRADRAWPLIYALHPSGTRGQDWAGQVRAMLGRRAAEFIIAAPDDYRQNYIAAKPPFTPEHPAILDAVARAFHIDATRVYALGYSKGGFGAWFVALYYPDRLAGAIAFAAGFDVPVSDDGFWKQVVQNAAHVPVYNAWGERDPLPAIGLDGKPDGTFADQNRRLVKGVFGLGLPITNIEVPGGVHHALAPPVEPMVTILATRRRADPRQVTHTFRHLHQASCYWLEGLSWSGDRWGDPWPPLPPAAAGETENQVLARTLSPLLGRLTGTIDGQTIRVTRRHIGDLAIWFGDRTVDWDKPVRIEVDGATVFEGRLTRDPAVALARAAATMDFDLLRWAGIRVDAAGKATVITADAVPGPAWTTITP